MRELALDDEDDGALSSASAQLLSAAPLLAAQPATRDGIRALPTVAQLLLLREASTAPRAPDALDAPAAPRHLLLANTHLYFANPAVHVRLLQTAKILERAHAWAAEVTPPSSTPPALVVAGDLNSDSTDAVLRLLTSGQVHASDHDWLHGALHWSPSLGLESAAREAAADAAAVLSLCLADGLDVEVVWAEQLGAPGSVAQAASVGEDACTLPGAQHLARRLHLLRKAMQRLARAAWAAGGGRATADVTTDVTDATDAADASQGLRTLAVTIVSDAAAGRSLIDSEALALAEVSKQLGLPLTAVLGAEPAEVVQAAQAKLAELAQQLEAASVALRARTSKQADGPDEAAVWAEQAAGMRLSQPTPLTSAYGLHTQPTHVVPRYANTLDWICLDAARLEVLGVAPLPSVDELTANVAIPSAEFPSDHVSLCCDLGWSDDGK